MKSLLLLTLCCWVGPMALAARPTPLREIGIDQKLDEQVPLDLPFRDEGGKLVRLGDYFGTKPVILVMAYYGCPMLCPLTFDGLVRAMRALPFNLGEQFEVVTVSFDPRETPALAAAKKKDYVAMYRRPGGEAGWHFLTGEDTAIHRLADAVGFRYKYDAASGQYAHSTGIMVLTPQGKVSRYFYGVEYAPRDLRLALVQASANKIGSVADEVLLFCFHYNPETGKYGLVIMRVIQVAGIGTVLALGSFMFWALRRERHPKPSAKPEAGSA